MKKLLFSLLFVIAASFQLISQNGAAINNSGAAADASAILDVSSTTQGQLLPRMTTAEMNAIVAPANGLIIYNTDCNTVNVNIGTTTAINWIALNPITAGVTISANPSGPICLGANVVFTATPLNGGSAPSYQWKVNGTNAGTNSNTFTFAPENGDVITCEMTSNAICVTGSPATSNSIVETVNALQSPTITYSGTPFCSNSGNVFVTQTGPSGGTYTALPAGLDINSTTGAINTGNSTAGTYAVTYSIGSACVGGSATTSVTITELPAPTISYTGSPYCYSAGTANVSLTGNTGGTFSSSPGGLSINSANGDVTLGSSSAGTYTVNYVIAAAGGCPQVTTSTPITVVGSGGSQTFSYTGGVQTFTVPSSCVNTITIEAYGAQGGNGATFNGGKGAFIKGTFSVNPGDVLSIMAGQQGVAAGNAGSGGGASYVWDSNNTLMIAAGAGGGGGFGTYGGAAPGQVTNDAANASNSASGGTNGNGGNGGPSGMYSGGGGGAGWLSNGITGSSAGGCTGGGGGITPLNGGAGGTASNCGKVGGYGGGGGAGDAGGGGAGYNGGGGGSDNPRGCGGGGGGSYISGTQTGGSADFQSGNGQIIISW